MSRLSRETQAEKVLRYSQEAVRKATGTHRRSWTITKFGRHADGYLHARVVLDGKKIYVHRRYGSWMAPDAKGSLMKELECFDFAAGEAKEVKEELQKKGRSFERAEAPIWPAQLWEEVNDGDDTQPDAGSTGEVPATDLRSGGDEEHARTATAELE